MLTNGFEIEVILLCKSFQQDEQVYFKYSLQTIAHTQEKHSYGSQLIKKDTYCTSFNSL